MEIEGTIEEIIYQNEINGYTVAEFETEEELTTASGYLPFINKGDSLKLQGNFIVHTDYGRYVFFIISFTTTQISSNLVSEITC